MSMFGGSAKMPVMARLNATIAQNENLPSSQPAPTIASNAPIANSSELLRDNEVFIDLIRVSKRNPNLENLI